MSRKGEKFRDIGSLLYIYTKKIKCKQKEDKKEEAK